MTGRQAGAVRDHGDYLRYLHGPDEHGTPEVGCRCGRCRAAARDTARAYRARRAHERWGAQPPVMVDAEPVRAHVRSLMAAGVPWKTVAKLAQVAEGGVARLLYGAPANVPPTPPTRRMTRRNAERLLAVRAEDALNVGGYVDAAGTMRRIRALVALGWSQSEIARRLGVNPGAMSRFMQCKRVSAERALAVRDLYARMWDTRPPEKDGYQRRDAAAARKLARAKRWPPPSAWDDDLLDLPEAELDAELARRAALMDDREVASCHHAYYRRGDISPVVVAAAREYDRRRRRRAAS